MNENNQEAESREQHQSKERFPWYTGKGDDGTTQLLGNKRVPKHSIQPETYGAVDEVTSALGLARSLSRFEITRETILTIQRHLYKVISELAATPENQKKYRFIESKHVEWVSQTTDEFGEKIEIPRDFVIPGDSTGGGALDLARSITRRAERRIVKAGSEGHIKNLEIAKYFNRLSSLCYVMARFEDVMAGKGEVTLAKEE